MRCVGCVVRSSMCGVGGAVRNVWSGGIMISRKLKVRYDERIRLRICWVFGVGQHGAER